MLIELWKYAEYGFHIWVSLLLPKGRREVPAAINVPLIKSRLVILLTLPHSRFYPPSKFASI